MRAGALRSAHAIHAGCCLTALNNERTRLPQRTCRFTPLSIRSAVATTVDGGYSCILAKFLRALLHGPHGSLTAGIPLDLGNGSIAVIWATITNLLADGEGLALAYQWNGASSIRCCLKHHNCVSKSSGLAALDTTGTFVDIACTDAGKFLQWNQGDIIANATGICEAREKLDSGEMRITAFNKMVTACGFKATRSGILQDRQLSQHIQWVEVATYDWMHTFLQNGVLTDELHAMYVCTGCAAATLHAFLKDGWRYPSWLPNSSRYGFEVFSEKRKPDNKLKATASETLGLYPLFRFWLETEFNGPPTVAPQLKSFMACCEVVALLMAAKHSGRAREGAEEIQRAMEKFLKLHLAAYKDLLIKPKTHWAMDIPDQLRRDGMVLDAFSLERLHLRAKRIAEQAKNTTRFEETAIAGLILSHLQSLREIEEEGLQGKTRILQEFSNTFQAISAAWKGIRVKRNDVVYHGNGLGQVVTCARKADEIPFCIVETYHRCENTSKHSSKWKATGGIAACSLHGLRFPRAWKELDDDVLLVID